MKFLKEHQGKWVASRGEKIIAKASSLKVLKEKIKKEKNKSSIKFIPVPKGFIAG